MPQLTPKTAALGGLAAGVGLPLLAEGVSRLRGDPAEDQRGYGAWTGAGSWAVGSVTTSLTTTWWLLQGGRQEFARELGILAVASQLGSLAYFIVRGNYDVIEDARPDVASNVSQFHGPVTP